MSEQTIGGGVRVDGDLCIGAGMCLTIAQHLFDIGDEGRAMLLREPQSADDMAAARDAAACCPAQAIIVGGLESS